MVDCIYKVVYSRFIHLRSIITGFILIRWHRSHNEVGKWISKGIALPLRKCQSMLLVKTKDNNGMIDSIVHLTLICWISVSHLIFMEKRAQPLFQLVAHSGIEPSFQVLTLIQRF